MKEKTIIILEVDYNWLAERQGQLQQVIMANQIEDPKKLDKAKYEQSLLNVGGMQMISEIIDKHPQTFKKI